MAGTTHSLAILAVALAAIGAASRPAEAADGAALFNANCAVCHSTEPGTNKLGPSLAGVLGRKSGSLGDYSYSPAMAKAGITWDRASLDRYLADPQAMVAGTRMVFLGVKSADDRKAIIDYLATLTN